MVTTNYGDFDLDHTYVEAAEKLLEKYGELEHTKLAINVARNASGQEKIHSEELGKAGRALEEIQDLYGFEYDPEEYTFKLR